MMVVDLMLSLCQSLDKHRTEIMKSFSFFQGFEISVYMQIRLWMFNLNGFFPFGSFQALYRNYCSETLESTDCQADRTL